jgi:hypothetical protein
MSHLAQHYGPAAGPLGFPMTDRAARTLDALLKSLPKGKEYEYRHLVSTRAPTELNPGERSDVSWISTESVDRTGEVVLARGMNDSQFQANPLVTLGHAYWLPPVGKSLWRKRARDGSLVGVKAKTQYPARRLARWRALAARQGPRPHPGRPAPGQVHRLSAHARPRPRREGAPEERLGQRQPRHRGVAAPGVRLRLPARQPGRPRRGRLERRC